MRQLPHINIFCTGMGTSGESGPHSTVCSCSQDAHPRVHDWHWEILEKPEAVDLLCRVGDLIKPSPVHPLPGGWKSLPAFVWKSNSWYFHTVGKFIADISTALGYAQLRETESPAHDPMRCSHLSSFPGARRSIPWKKSPRLTLFASRWT